MGADGWSSKQLNQLDPADRSIHDWYRFVLSFPPHLVRDYLTKFGISSQQRVLDPFAGTGTTLVECKKQGIPSVGIEANPMAHFACRTKLDWRPDPQALLAHGQDIAARAEQELAWLPGDGLRHTLPEASEQLLLKNSISPIPLHKALVLLGWLDRRRDERFEAHEKLALMKAVVFSASNLRFAPEVGVGRQKQDAPLIADWLTALETMAQDLRSHPAPVAPSTIHHADARQLLTVLAPNSIDAVITSPPYPNEKDYTRTTRLESVLLGFLRDKADLRRIKEDLIRSNSRNIYTRDTDDQWIEMHSDILAIADAIDQRRAELGKTSGFSRLYSRVVKLYFGGMAKHLKALQPVLRPGAQLAYVVGDQASYLGVLIRTGELLATIAESLGYEVVNIDLFRTRRAASNNEALKEEVVLLRWAGR